MPPKKALRGVKIRNWTKEDLSAIVECQQLAYPNFKPAHLCSERHYELQLNAFPEGQYLAEYQGRVVGYAASLIVQLDESSPWYSYSEITGAGTFSTHDPQGDTLYGADIAVIPEFRGKGVAQMLYKKRRALLVKFNLKRMVAGGRIPGYKDHVGQLTPEQYVDKVVRGELKDPALNTHLRAGYSVRSVHMDYVRDEASLNYATYLELINEKFRPERRRVAASPVTRPVRRVRVCCAQYEMRMIKNVEEFERQVDFFVETADEYHCHFLLFPELFTAQLFSLYPPDTDTIEAIKMLSAYTGRFKEMMIEQAKRTGITIIAGSHPVLEEDGLIYNRSFLFTPSGNTYFQDKLHITPGERKYWNIQPGKTLKVFESSLARFAIQVCYDIEFPEASRMVTLGGAEAIFVPFATDERKAYTRVRYCAQARAVENMLYVAIAGNVGNLPQVDSFLINYGQAAVFTPSDISFPLNGIAGEADSNVETVVISDLDLSALSLQREMGSVRPLRDRRPDLYDLRMNVPIELVKVD